MAEVMTPANPDAIHAKLVALLSAEAVEFQLTHHDPVTELRSGAKAMLVKARAGFVLAVLAGDRKVDWKLLAPLVGGKGARLATDEELLEVIGLEQGRCSAARRSLRRPHDLRPQPLRG